MGDKIDIGKQGFIYPMPMTLVGADIGGKPTFMPLAWVNRIAYNPPRLMVAMNKAHATNEGIRQHGQFSVNLPSVDMMAKVDWAGLVSAREVDKGREFEIFRGSLEHAPMLAECPLTLECTLCRAVDVEGVEIFIGDIAGTWTEERFLTGGKPDLPKMKPFVLTMPDNRYWAVGDTIADAWKIGRTYEPKG